MAGPGAAAGGVWAVAGMQSAALRRSGQSVELLGGWLGAVPAPPVIDAGTGTARPEMPARLFRVRRPLPGAKLRGLVSLSLPRHVARRAATADAVHVHLSRDFITTVSTVLLRRSSTPVVAQSHGMLVPSATLPVRVFDAVITRWLVRIPRLWLTLTEDEERGLRELGVDRARMRRVVNASAESMLAWSDPEQPVFLFAARLAARKQPAVFVEAALAALDAGLEASFVLAGPDQGEGRRIRELIAASPHSGRFQMAGELTAPQVQAAMAACTAYVLPARNEPYPMSVLEAAATGTPMILTDECGLAEDLSAADAAVVTAPTVASFREAMLKLAADPQRRRELGANAQRVHRKLWSTEKLAEDLTGHYLEAIHER
ncbi:glycosyltransferase [Arthrobacter sp. APC 3897]|uniref:glycosyltransferase n=1 Tax=Arthrobacter sp. APC 3897 TaxID=3035204 RepID=UPI0025B598C7|nr:glycosyltransferase [Arthrobacter sp. APC 3897]